MKVSWYHNMTTISYSGPRPGVSMITDKSPNSVRVTLIIADAGADDSGLYTCHPDSARSPPLPMANVTVNVLDQTDYTAMLSQAGLFKF